MLAALSAALILLQLQQLLLQPPHPVDLLVAAVVVDHLAAVAVAVAVAAVDHLVVDLLVAAEDTVEDIDPSEFINMDISKDGLILVYKSVSFHLDKWCGGDPREQEALFMMKDNLLRIILEQQFQKPEGSNFWRDFFSDFLVIKSRFWF